MGEIFPPGFYTIFSVQNQTFLLCQPDGTLQFVGENANDPDAIFIVEGANVDNHLVNIRSHNGNYWRTVDPARSRIGSLAVDPHEDVSSWYGTLFKIMTAGTRDHEYRILQKYHENFIEPTAEDGFNAYALQDNLTDNQILRFEQIA
ncbi:unnamed protein product [Prunus armeniaca]